MAEIGFEKRDFRMVSPPRSFSVLFVFLSSDTVITAMLQTECLCSLKVVFCMDRALESAPACHKFKILKAECLALLGRYPEAQSVAR